MGEYIPEVDVPDIYQKLETLIGRQLTEEKSVGEVLTAFETPIVSVGIMDDGDITATMLGSPKISTSYNYTRFRGRLSYTDTLFLGGKHIKGNNSPRCDQALPGRQARARCAYLTVSQSRTDILDLNPYNSVLGLTDLTPSSVVPQSWTWCFWFPGLLYG
jgi:hypothetical protein